VGAGAVVFLYLPYLASLGFSNAVYALRLLDAGENARHLPVASVIDPAGSLLYLALVADGLLLIAGFARRKTVEGVVYLSVALVSVGLLPYAIWTEDRSHVGPAALSLIVAPAAFGVVVQLLRPLGRRALLVGIGLLAAIAPLGVLVVSSAFAPAVPLVPSTAYAVKNSGREFFLDSPESAADANAAVKLVARIAPHGRLFVGPRDLRDPGSVDAYLYYLLPHLRPATFFVVLDPGTTTMPRHSLARELPTADVLILDSSINWPVIGHALSAANQVVARDFCIAGEFGSMSVFRRCHRRA
jgi:hypothetical protein